MRARGPPAEASDARGPRADARVRSGDRLAAQAEPADDGPVARVVLLDQVRKKAAALANELEEAAARVVVLGEAPQVLRQLLDPLRQERDLDLRRAGVTVLTAAYSAMTCSFCSRASGTRSSDTN